MLADLGNKSAGSTPFRRPRIVRLADAATRLLFYRIKLLGNTNETGDKKQTRSEPVEGVFY